jgi:integrase
MDKENRLTAVAIKNATPGRHHDGRGLYLDVSRKGNHAKSWIFQFMRIGKTRSMGLGPIHAFSLAEARARARKCRQLLADGLDPLEERRKDKSAKLLAVARSTTFAAAAEAFVKSREAKWKDPKHAAAWRSSFRLHCGLISQLPVETIDTTLLVDMLTPLWNTTPAAAKKLRLRLEQVLDAAKVRGLRQGDNPARWRGHLDKLFISPAKVRPVKHYPAVPADEVPGVMARIAERDTIASKALRFLALTAVRSEQVRRMRWSEIDSGLWVCPPEHVKAEKGSTRPHRIPLSQAALAILDTMPRNGDQVFPMGTNAMRDALREVHPTGTPHGLRSAFKDWARTQPFADELSELALGHSVGDGVRRAYARNDLVEERRPLMEAWAAYLIRPKTTDDVVVPLLRAAAHG